jgi:hypothetical protein
MSNLHETWPASETPLTLALTFGGNELFLVGRQEAPLWMRRRGPWRRPVQVSWHRMDQIPGHWWLAQRGRELVVLGQGMRPALMVQKAGAPWQGLIPAGRQSTMVTLPDSSDYTVRPILDR